MQDAEAGTWTNASVAANQSSLAISDPPQYNTVAFHPPSTVNGNMTLDALAGYVLTACGTSGSGYSSFLAVSNIAAARLMFNNIVLVGKRCAIG